MTYEVISLGKDFQLGSERLPNMPFVLDYDSGEPYEPINRYIRYDCRKNKPDTTVRRKVDSIVEYVNFLDRGVRIGGAARHSYKYFESNETLLMAFKAHLQEGNNIGKTGNKCISAVFQFLWWCEHDERDHDCQGVIGITDAGKGVKKFPLPVHASKRKTDAYRVDRTFFFKETGKSASQKDGQIDRDWDHAYEELSNSDKPEDYRDSLMVRLVRAAYLRRIALVNLPIEQFASKLTDQDRETGEKHIFIQKDKYDKAHWVGIPIGLYQDVQEFIEDIRPELLIKGDKKNHYVFNGKVKGQPISNRQVNNRLKQVGLQTHDGRRLGLTEAFVHYIRLEMSKEDAMLLVKQHANHSEKTSNRVLEEAYLRAEIIARDAEYTSVSELKIKVQMLEEENLELRQRIEELEADKNSFAYR